MFHWVLPGLLSEITEPPYINMTWQGMQNMLSCSDRTMKPACSPKAHLTSVFRLELSRRSKWRHRQLPHTCSASMGLLATAITAPSELVPLVPWTAFHISFSTIGNWSYYPVHLPHTIIEACQPQQWYISDLSSGVQVSRLNHWWLCVYFWHLLGSSFLTHSFNNKQHFTHSMEVCNLTGYALQSYYVFIYIPYWSALMDFFAVCFHVSFS